MAPRINDTDRLRLAGAVSDHVNRLGGVVGFWTLLPFMPDLDGRGFVESNVRNLHHSLALLRGLLVSTGALEDETVRRESDRMTAMTDRLLPVFTVLLEFRTAPPSAVGRAVTELQEVHDVTLEAAQRISGRLHLVPDVFGGGWADRERRQRDILARLPELFEQREILDRLPGPTGNDASGIS